MLFLSWVRWLSLSVLMPMTISANPLTNEEQQALKIQGHLEERLYTLPLEQQGEYALMLYRTTGNKTYLNTARVSLFLSADRLQMLAGSMSNRVNRQTLILEESLSVKPELLEQFTDYFFYGFKVLPELLRIDRFAMALKGGTGGRIDRGVSGVNFRQALSTSSMLESYAPEMAKQVYALLRLDYGDYRQIFIEHFMKLYPDNRDVELSVEQRADKWLTMTHLVLAASDQLQEPVNDPLLNWIPEYFQNKESLLLQEGGDTLLAKIGLSLLLTGHNQSSLLSKIKSHIAKRPWQNAVDDSDFWGMLLLGWVEDYYPDPALYQMKKFKGKMPYVLKSVD